MDNAKDAAGGPAKKAEKLTELQQAFVREYVVDFVASQALRRAQKRLGKKVADDATARVDGCRMLARANVRAAADKLRDETAYESEDMRRRIIDELVAIAYSNSENLARLVRYSCSRCWDDGDPRVTAANREAINPDCKWCRGRGASHIEMTPTDELSHADRRLFDGIEYTQHGIKIKTRDRTKALEMLAKHFGIGPDRLELSGRDGGPIEITGARDRLMAVLSRRAPRS